MSQQVGRTHFTDELSIELPSAMIRKGFGFDQDSICLQEQSRRESNKGGDEEFVHFEYVMSSSFNAGIVIYSKDPWNLTAASVVEEFLQLRFHLGEDLGVLFGHVFFFGRIFG